MPQSRELIKIVTCPVCNLNVVCTIETDRVFLRYAMDTESLRCSLRDFDSIALCPALQPLVEPFILQKRADFKNDTSQS